MGKKKQFNVPHAVAVTPLPCRFWGYCGCDKSGFLIFWCLMFLFVRFYFVFFSFRPSKPSEGAARTWAGAEIESALVSEKGQCYVKC